MRKEHIEVLQQMFAVCANERRMMEADALSAAIVAARYAADMEDSLRQLHEAVGMDPRSPDTDKLIARIRALSAGASGGGVPEWWSRFVANAAAALDKSGDRGMAARMMELHRAMTDPASPVTGEPDLTRHNPIMLPPHMKETQRRQIAEANTAAPQPQQAPAHGDGVWGDENYALVLADMIENGRNNCGYIAVQVQGGRFQRELVAALRRLSERA